MKGAFNKIIIGFIFFIVSVNVYSIDFLTNVLAYCFIYLGCKELKMKSKYFKRVINTLPIAIILSIILYNKNIYSDFFIISLAIGTFLFRGIEAYVIYNICKGICEIEKEVFIKDNCKVIKKSLCFYLCTFFILQIIAPFLMITGNIYYKMVLSIFIMILFASKICLSVNINLVKKDILDKIYSDLNNIERKL